MFPIRDNIPNRTLPLATITLIASNIAAFLFELSQGRYINEFISKYGFVPARFFNDLLTLTWNPAEFIFPLFSSMFLHGGWMHLISNCWYLYIFGHSVENRLGRTRFILFYLVSGLFAILTQALSHHF